MAAASKANAAARASARRKRPAIIDFPPFCPDPMTIGQFDRPNIACQIAPVIRPRAHRAAAPARGGCCGVFVLRARRRASREAHDRSGEAGMLSATRLIHERARGYAQCAVLAAAALLPLEHPALAQTSETPIGPVVGAAARPRDLSPWGMAAGRRR